MKITLVDYIGNSDENGNPIGHPLKTVNTYYNLLKNDLNLEVVVPKNYKRLVEADDIKFLDYFKDMTEDNIFIKIVDIFKRYINIRKAFSISNNEIIWFMNIDFVLFLFLLIHKPKNKLVVNMYNQKSIGKTSVKNLIKDFIYKKGIRKIDLIFSSDIKLDLKNSVYIPDYFYDKSIYHKFSDNSEDYFLCIGNMNEGKNIEKLVEIFNKNSLKLKIIGKFWDEKKYELINEFANKNVEVKNTYLSEEEYYEMISKAKFVILPYKKELYNGRSSGVLLESLFMKKTVIAPKFLLDYHDLPGVKYGALDDLDFKNISKIDDFSFLKKFEIDNIKIKIINHIDKI